MTHVHAYNKLTGEKRRIPEKWLRVFPDAWSLTPSTRGARAAAPVDPPVSTEAGSDPAQPDTSREDQ